MDTSLLTSIRSADYERRIDMRPDIGATASVQQRSRLRFAHLSVSQPSIIVIVKGEKTLQHQAMTTAVEAGQAIVLDHGTYDIINRPAADGLYEAFWLAWDHSHITAFATRTPTIKPACPQHLLHIEPDFYAALLNARQGLMRDDIPAAIARHRMEEVLWWLCEKGIAFEARTTPSLITRLGHLLAGQPDHDWTLSEVADRLAIGQATLRRRLAADGKTFSDILIDTRMSLALTLLQCTDQPINRIALDVGYESASRFAVRFRKRFGFAPSEVRGHSR
ncbi:helix-turn-helix transcriptional regulator [Asticcacaulis benevestitus]|nr:helix-turn-helix transcriptional regulator [Asticcacaulis benevestitus]